VGKEKTQFKKGEAPGRPPGVQNKITRTVKETVLKVFNDLQNDPKHNLTAFAKSYPRDFYNISAKLIPTEISANVKSTTVIVGMQILENDSNSNTIPAQPSGTEVLPKSDTDTPS